MNYYKIKHYEEQIYLQDIYQQRYMTPKWHTCGFMYYRDSNNNLIIDKNGNKRIYTSDYDINNDSPIPFKKINNNNPTYYTEKYNNINNNYSNNNNNPTFSTEKYNNYSNNNNNSTYSTEKYNNINNNNINNNPTYSTEKYNNNNYSNNNNINNNNPTYSTEKYNNNNNNNDKVKLYVYNSNVVKKFLTKGCKKLLVRIDVDNFIIFCDLNNEIINSTKLYTDQKIAYCEDDVINNKVKFIFTNDSSIFIEY